MVSKGAYKLKKRVLMALGELKSSSPLTSLENVVDVGALGGSELRRSAKSSPKWLRWGVECSTTRSCKPRLIPWLRQWSRARLAANDGQRRSEVSAVRILMLVSLVSIELMGLLMSAKIFFGLSFSDCQRCWRPFLQRVHVSGAFVDWLVALTAARDLNVGCCTTPNTTSKRLIQCRLILTRRFSKSLVTQNLCYAAPKKIFKYL